MLVQLQLTDACIYWNIFSKTSINFYNIVVFHIETILNELSYFTRNKGGCIFCLQTNVKVKLHAVNRAIN